LFFLHFFVALGRKKEHIPIKLAKIYTLHMPLAIRWTERRRVSSAGFTLLELVVVVAIAGVLMALLLPALSSAKEKSRRSVCGQNIRQDLTALTMYGADDEQGRLPPATDNKGAYHSIRLSDFTFTNLVANYLADESNSFYCPNLVYATGKMGGYDPSVGYTIGYSYLAAQGLPLTPRGPGQDWTGPLKADETGEVIADANYWSTKSSQLMSVAPHTASGSIVATQAAAGSGIQPASAFQAPGASSTAIGAAGGNIGSLNGSVIWQPIHSMKEYPAAVELDGSSGAFGNW
jgi:prepilin-type N-terminal cleavage/methylation domain-containing protein